MLLFISVSHNDELMYVFEKNKIIFYKKKKDLRGYQTSSFLIDVLIEMQKNNLIQKIHKIILSSGPGSFTSIRIADIFINSIALKYNIDILRVNIFEELLFHARKHKLQNYIVLIPTGRNLYALSMNDLHEYNCNYKQIKINDVVKSAAKYIVYEDHYNGYIDIINKYCMIDSDFFTIKHKDNFVFDEIDRAFVADKILYYA